MRFKVSRVALAVDELPARDKQTAEARLVFAAVAVGPGDGAAGTGKAVASGVIRHLSLTPGIDLLVH